MTKTIKGYKEYLKYLDKTFPSQAPHEIVIMGAKEYKKYKAEHKSPWRKPPTEEELDDRTVIIDSGVVSCVL